MSQERAGFGRRRSTQEPGVAFLASGRAAGAGISRAGDLPGEIEQAFQVPGDADQRPFTGYRVESPEVKLPESQHGFDDSKHRLDRGFALSVNGPALDRR